MPSRLLLLLACAVVAALLWPRRSRPVAPSVRRPNVSRWNDGAERRADEPLVADPYLCGLAG